MEIEAEVRFYCLNSDKFPTIHLRSFFGNCSFRIDKAEWVNSIEGEEKFDNDYVDALIYYMESKMDYEEFPEETQWSLARKIWNLNHWDNRVEKMEMPDYSLLKTT